MLVAAEHGGAGSGAGRIERDAERVDAAREGKAAIITRPSLYSSPRGVFSGQKERENGETGDLHDFRRMGQ